MGYYIETPENFGKAEHLIAHEGATRLHPDVFDPPPDKVWVCVVQNHYFEAAGIAYDAQEFRDWTFPDDPRPMIWLEMSKARALELCPDLRREFR